MKFSNYFQKLSKDEKESLAERLETSVKYLGQLSTKFRNPSKKLMEKIAVETNKSVNILDWFEVEPEKEVT